MPEPDERVGQTLKGRWRIDRLIGTGGMAAVYEARHRNQARVAIKILHSHLGLSSEQRRRFQMEGYAANRVEHPGVVRVLDDDITDDGCAFLVMDLLSGRTLAEKAAAQGGRLVCREVVDLSTRVLDVLIAAHAQGIIHRDIKPANLFLTDEGRLVVLDFGIARIADIRPPGDQTAAGTLLGTPGFISPEQALGNVDEVGAPSDLWAVGATMFTLISGRHVHPGRTPNEQLALAMTRPAPPIRTVAPETPAALATVIDRALAFDTRDRWPTAAAMQQALEKVATHWEAIPEHPEGMPQAVDLDSIVDAPHATAAGGQTAAPTAPGLTDDSPSRRPPAPPESARRKRMARAAWIGGGLGILGLSVLPFLFSPIPARSRPEPVAPSRRVATELVVPPSSSSSSVEQSDVTTPLVAQLDDAPAAVQPSPRALVTKRALRSPMPKRSGGASAIPSGVTAAPAPAASVVEPVEPKPASNVYNRRH